jgi:hypothetical protein
VGSSKCEVGGPARSDFQLQTSNFKLARKVR